MPTAHLREIPLLRRLRERLNLDASRPAGVPFGDDMAGLPTDPAATLWTTDTLMDGVDFRSQEHSWRQVGAKAIAVNLSDCAAMGARPVGALVSVVLPAGMSEDEAVELHTGLAEFGNEYGCPLVGGDINAWGGLAVITVAVAASTQGRRPVLRSGARPGDRLWVSGPLGGSILGRHLEVRPRVHLGQQLATVGAARAMIDLSDGLALDVHRLAEASGVGVVLQAGQIDAVIHADARCLAQRTGRAPREHALSDGEDFELLVALSPDIDGYAFDLRPVGSVTEKPGVWIEESGRRDRLAPRGWEHAT